MTALDGWSGHIAALGYGIQFDEAKCHSIARDRPDGTVNVSLERPALVQFFRDVGLAIIAANRTKTASGQADYRVRFIGHNIRRFDVLFLWQRCVVLGITPPVWLEHARNAARHDDTLIYDTMEKAGNTRSDKQYGPGLDRLCRCLGIRGKGDVSGAGVWAAIQEGRIEEVALYCRKDVARARSAARKIQGKDPHMVDLLLLEPPGVIAKSEAA